jgi:hypothetical protein
MATEKTTKKKKKSSEGSAKSSAVEKSADEKPKGSAEPEMRSALLPLIWLLIPFVAVVVYGLLTRE